MCFIFLELNSALNKLAWRQCLVLGLQCISASVLPHFPIIFLFHPAEIVYRWFDTNPGQRQTADVIKIDDWATTAGECAISCLSTYNCISFNFMKAHDPICEPSSVPWDAVPDDYRNAAGWTHYKARLDWRNMDDYSTASIWWDARITAL